ncbi:hypothetical protein Tco_1484822 [Tanacetum coccineum]
MPLASRRNSDTFDTSNATLAILKNVIGCNTWKNDPRLEIGGFRNSDTFDTSNATLAILKNVIGCNTWKNDPRLEIGGFRSVWNEWMGLMEWDAPPQALDPSPTFFLYNTYLPPSLSISSPPPPP